jgi:hypothetical protein
MVEPWIHSASGGSIVRIIANDAAATTLIPAGELRGAGLNSRYLSDLDYED